MSYTKNNKRTAEEMARKAYGCFIDKAGNRPCDNGASCDYCSSAAFKEAVERIMSAKTDKRK